MRMDISIKNLYRKRQTELDPKKQLLYMDRLLYFLQNGYPLLQALDRMRWDKRLQALASQSKHLLQKGQSFDYVLQELGFRRRLYSFMAVTRQNGDLQGSLSQCQSMLQNEMEHIQTFKSQLRYPLFLIFLFLVVLYFVRTSIYPSFQQLFASANNTSALLPLSITIMDGAFQVSLFILFAFFLFLPLWRWVAQTFTARSLLQIYSYIPIFRHFLKMRHSFFFSLLLSSLLKSGTSIQQALTILSNQTDMPILSYHAERMLLAFRSGHQLPENLSDELVLERECLTIFQLDANTKKVEKDLFVYAELVNSRLQTFVTTLLKLVQPIFFSILAIFIVLVYLSFMLPMFQLMKTI